MHLFLTKLEIHHKRIPANCMFSFSAFLMMSHRIFNTVLRQTVYLKKLLAGSFADASVNVIGKSHLIPLPKGFLRELIFLYLLRLTSTSKLIS